MSSKKQLNHSKIFNLTEYRGVIVNVILGGTLDMPCLKIPTYQNFLTPQNHKNLGPHSYNSIENATHYSQPSH